MTFLQQMRKIKKQGYYFSNGELDAEIAGLSVPIRFSSKDAPYALTLLASKNRFEFVNLQKLIEILQDNAQQIEKQVEILNTDLSLDVNSSLTWQNFNLKKMQSLFRKPYENRERSD